MSNMNWLLYLNDHSDIFVMNLLLAHNNMKGKSVVIHWEA